MEKLRKVSEALDRTEEVLGTLLRDRFEKLLTESQSSFENRFFLEPVADTRASLVEYRLWRLRQDITMALVVGAIGVGTAVAAATLGFGGDISDKVTAGVGLTGAVFATSAAIGLRLDVQGYVRTSVLKISHHISH